MVRQCTIRNCRNVWQPNTNVSYHGFPMKNVALLEKWMQAIPPELTKTPTKYTSICSVHFPPECFEIKPPHFKLINRLKKDAVPSIFNNYDKSTFIIQDHLMDMLISSEDSNPETQPEKNNERNVNDAFCAENTRINYEITKRDGSKCNVGVQTSSKKFKPSEKEKKLKKQIALLQQRLERRDTRIKSLMELINQLKKHVAAVQKSKLKFTEIS